MEVSTSTIVRSLIGSGFEVLGSLRKPSHLVFQAIRWDEFGVEWRYLFAFTGGGRLSAAEVAGLRGVAKNEGSSLIVVGDAEGTPDGVPVFTPEDFVARLGGAVPSFLPLEAEYGARLKTLGRNELPDGLAGEPDDLFEQYVHSGLQFLLQERVIRYGQERRFEAVPDGVVLGRGAFLMLYDCKAAGGGYDVSRDTIRQFGDYVRSFHRRYGKYIDRLHAFLVVSGDFRSGGTLQARSDELYADCQVRLVFLSAGEMGQIVEMLAERPAYRQSIDWPTIFSATVVQASAVKKSLAARVRDRVIRP